MLNKMSHSNDNNKKCEFQKKLFFYIYSGCKIVVIAISYIIEKNIEKLPIPDETTGERERIYSIGIWNHGI
jgi:hypothetical protein